MRVWRRTFHCKSACYCATSLSWLFIDFRQGVCRGEV